MKLQICNSGVRIPRNKAVCENLGEIKPASMAAFLYIFVLILTMQVFAGFRQRY
jgi:hypothetical protein